MIRQRKIAWLLVFWCCLFEIKVKAALSFESPNDQERFQPLPGELLRSLSGDGLIVGSKLSALVLTNNWVQRPGFQNLRFPLAVDYQGRIVCPSSNTNRFLTRFNPDGSVDSSFLAPAMRGQDIALISDLQTDPDGKVIVSCSRSSSTSPFFGFNNGLFRVNEDGSIDNNYTPDPQESVRSTIVLQDKKVLVNTYSNVRRFLFNGSPDPSYTVPQVSGVINAMALQPDGKLVVVGSFNDAAGVPHPGIARFFSDGNWDFTFAPTNRPGLGEPIEVKVQSDGRILTGHVAGAIRWQSNGERDYSFLKLAGGFNIYDFEIDDVDRILIIDGGGLYRYSGRYRVRVEALNVPQVLERSSLINAGWSPAMTVPANTSKDYLIPDFPGLGNTFYRARPSQ